MTVPTRTLRRNRRAKPTDGGLDDLFEGFGWLPEQAMQGPGHRARTLLAGLLALAASTALVLAITSPVVGSFGFSVKAGSAYWFSLPTTLPSDPLPTKSIILAADGTKIGQFYSENRIPVTFDQIPQVVQEALVDTEDSRFYLHDGIDVRGTARALAHDFLGHLVGGGGAGTQGGSTITQQYVKNLLADAATTNAAREAATSQTSLLRKVKEARLATALERRESKHDILTGYLNISYFGDGAYGIGAAARHYFDIPLSRVSPAQAALLIGLVKNPNGYDPTRHPDAAKARRDVVLSLMHSHGDLSQTDYQTALSTPVALHVTTPPNGCTTSPYPFFCQWVKQTIQNDPVFGATAAQREAVLYRGGLTIHTTLDIKAQNLAQQSVDAALGRSNRVAAAVVVVQPGTGAVIAMASNRTFGTPTRKEQREGDFTKTQVVYGLQHAMQPGSNFKPFTLAAALERGFDPATVMNAPAVYAPSDLNYPDRGYTNDGSGDAGTFNVRTALARSSNTWFVKLEEQVGVLNAADMAERLGITSLPRTGTAAITPRDGALTLGAYEVSPVEMAGAYATFAAHGVHCDPHPIASITGPDASGHMGPVAVPDADCHQAIQPAVADEVADIMRGVIDGPDPLRTGAKQTIGRPAAGKTGTTQNRAAVWFSGFTPQYATSVWVGDPRGGFKYPLKGFYAYGQYVAAAYGGTVAGPIWQKVMAGIHQGLPVEQFTKPSQTIATGTLVPDVQGMTLSAAYHALKQAGFKATIAPLQAPQDSVIAADTVVRTSPAAGSFLGTNTTVAITMSAGSDRNIRLQ